MSYSKDYRKRTIEYREEGHTLEETHKVFKVAIGTIRAWEKQWKEKGTLEPAPVVRTYKKIDPERLQAYIQVHPDAYLKEIAKEFGCCESAIRKAFDRLGITRKKDNTLPGTESRKGVDYKYKNGSTILSAAAFNGTYSNASPPGSAKLVCAMCS